MSGGRIMFWAIELDLLDPDDELVTLTLSDLPVRPWPSADPDKPNVSYDPRIVEVPSIAVDLYSDPSRLVGSLGTAQLVLGNADGLLNAYRGYVFKNIRAWWGELKATGRAFAADMRQVLAGRAETPSWAVSATQPSRLAVPVYDLRADLDVDIQDELFAGTNVGAAGYEGTADDLGGQPKPLALGDLTTGNIPLEWVNAEGQVGQAHAGQMQEYTALYDRGADAGLAADGDLADAAFDAAAPAIDHQVTDLGRGLIKVTANFGGVVTAGVKGAVDLVAGDGYRDTAPPLISALIRRQNADASIGDTFATIAAPAKVGLYIADTSSTRSAVEMFARSLPGWILPDPLGVWQIGTLRLPGAVPLRTITDVDILSIAPGDTQISTPVWKVTVKGGRLYQTHNRQNLAGSLWKTDEEARLRQEYRTAVRVDETLRDRWWPNVRTVEIETARRYQADLQDVADLLFDCTSVRSDGTPFQEWIATTELDEEWLDILASPGIGAADIAVVYAPEGIDRVMTIMGAKVGRPASNQITLRVWG